MRTKLALLSSLVFVGCASMHDLSSGRNSFGGGVSSTEIRPGFFRILARTNWAPWSNFSAAKSSWQAVANSACGEGKWKEISFTEEARDAGIQQMGVLSYIVTERVGYALCQNAATTEAEAKALASANTL